MEHDHSNGGAPDVDDSPSPLQEQDEFRKFATFRLALFEFQRRSEAILDQFEIGNRQFYAMLIIKSGAGQDLVTVGAVARGMDIHPSSASGLIARLEAAGLVERIFDLENRRQVRVRLTAQGDSLLTKIIDTDSQSPADLTEQYNRLLGPGV